MQIIQPETTIPFIYNWTQMPKENAAKYGNSIHAYIFDTGLNKVCPPYLHILLGNAKRHHDLLELKCHELVTAIAIHLATTDVPLSDSLFELYVQKLRHNQVLEKEKDWIHPPPPNRSMVYTCKHITGKVLWAVIVPGYRQHNTCSTLCHSIENSVSTLCDATHIADMSEAICQKFPTSNSLYSKMHISVSW